MCSFPRPGIRWCLGHAQGFMFLIQAGAKAKEAARGEEKEGGGFCIIINGTVFFQGQRNHAYLCLSCIIGK